MAQDIDARGRRARQFEHCLDLMEIRARNLAKQDCFVIFSRRVPARLLPAMLMFNSSAEHQPSALTEQAL